MRERVYVTRTGRINIRHYTSEDARIYFRYTSDKRLCKYLICNEIKNIKEATEILREIIKQYSNTGAIHWKLCISDSNTDELIGNISIHIKNKGSLIEVVELGYWIGYEHQGKGLATEALNVMAKKLLNFGVKTIYLCIHKDNEASKRVAYKCGFRRDKRISDNIERWKRT